MMRRFNGLRKYAYPVSDTNRQSNIVQRFTECTSKLTTFLKGLGYNPKTDLAFIPMSAQTGLGVKERVPANICSWYQGPSLLEYLDTIPAFVRHINAPLMLPISAKFKDSGTIVEGKIEAGIIKKGGTYLVRLDLIFMYLSKLIIH
jgi:peptide chain release factor subunit 3